MNIKIFVGLMFLAAMALAILLVIAYKRNRGTMTIMMISIFIMIMMFVSIYNIRIQEWEVAALPSSRFTDENNITIELYKAKREWLFLYEDSQIRKILVPAGTPEEHYAKYLEEL